MQPITECGIHKEQSEATCEQSGIVGKRHLDSTAIDVFQRTHVWENSPTLKHKSPFRRRSAPFSLVWFGLVSIRFGSVQLGSIGSDPLRDWVARCKCLFSLTLLSYSWRMRNCRWLGCALTSSWLGIFVKCFETIKANQTKFKAKKQPIIFFKEKLPFASYCLSILL